MNGLNELTASVEETEPLLPYSTLQAESFGFNGNFKTYEDDSTDGMIGIDVSDLQLWIDWETVATSPVEFAILRAGYRGYEDGSLHQDQYLEYNLETATACGLDVGLYFFSQAVTTDEAIEEAELVLTALNGRSIDMPVFFDWEYVDSDTSRTQSMASSEIMACANAFCETIERSGYEAGIYFSTSMGLDCYNLPELQSYAFWVAEYSDSLSFPYHADCWQYSSTGTIPGTEDDMIVDLDLYFKEKSE